MSSIIKQQSYGIATETQDGLVGENSIYNSHLSENAITGNKIAATTLVNPIHHSYHLSGSFSAGWVRVAQLKNLSSVEFWLRTTTSGNHSVSKWTFNYTFYATSKNPISWSMSSNTNYGTPLTKVRIVRNSTYDDVYLEVYINAALTVNVSQISASGSTFDNYSNIALEVGSIPSGYTADESEINAVSNASSGINREFNKPVFNVASDVGRAVNSQQLYEKVYLNNGSHYSTSSSRFTAPVTGMYYFEWSTIKQSSNTSLVHRQYIRKNGVIQLGGRHLRLSESSNYGDGSCAAILLLNANDYIDIYIQDSSIGSHSADDYTWLQGYLIG